MINDEQLKVKQLIEILNQLPQDADVWLEKENTKTFHGTDGKCSGANHMIEINMSDHSIIKSGILLNRLQEITSVEKS